jgi:NAD(P)-dependent dehydrogenase (short-subunit alcohol dehydrogenase family)
METAIIAGVGPGLGASLARMFAQEGYAVALLSRGGETTQRVAEQIRLANGKALAIQVDVTKRESVIKAVEQVRTELGRITALAYNASDYGRGGLLELNPKIIEQSFQAGVMGAVYLSQAVIPDMLAAGHGFISLTGATAALRGRAGFAPLAIAKASLRMLGQSLAREFHPKGIHVVHVIVDGQIDTPKLRGREPNRSQETLLSPDSIAAAVLFTLKQTPDAWTHEFDLRPHLETF